MCRLSIPLPLAPALSSAKSQFNNLPSSAGMQIPYNGALHMGFEEDRMWNDQNHLPLSVQCWLSGAMHPIMPNHVTTL